MHTHAYIKAFYDAKIWAESEKLTSGLLFENMMSSKKMYKKYLTKLKLDSRDRITNELHSNLMGKNKRDFWKTWKSKFSTPRPLSCSLDGAIVEASIANLFTSTIAKNCSPNCLQNCMEASSRVESKLKNYRSRHNVDYHLEVENVDNIIRGLGKNQSAGFDGLTAEHILYAHSILIVVITRLLDVILSYELVPKAFGHSITFLIPKGDKKCSSNSSENYRGISISPIFSKIYELCLLKKLKDILLPQDCNLVLKKGWGVIMPYILYIKQWIATPEGDQMFTYVQLISKRLLIK